MSIDSLAALLGALGEIPARMAALEHQLNRMANALASLPPTFARIEDAAAACNVSPATMRRWVRRNLVPVVRVAGTVRVDLARLRPPDELETARLAASARAGAHGR